MEIMVYSIMGKLEVLLNNLIKKGWKPFGKNAIKFDYDGIKTCCGYGAITYLYRDSYIDDYGDKVEYEEWQHQFNNRELVSKESGLWQFVCENKLLKHGVYTGAKWQRRKKYDNYWNTDIQVYKPEYRIIESALRDESELEDFLLSKIKIEGK